MVTLLVTDEASRQPRPTEDVDVVIELTTRASFYDLENSLRSIGFSNVMEGPICRFRHGMLILDVMPTDPDILGFSNRWYESAIRSSEKHTLTNKITINLISAACFLATKLEAFDSPNRENRGDMIASRDFEDVVTVIDGRPTIVHDMHAAEPMVAEYLLERFTAIMRERYWVEGLEAHLDDPERSSVVAGRIRDFTRLGEITSRHGPAYN